MPNAVKACSVVKSIDSIENFMLRWKRLAGTLEPLSHEIRWPHGKESVAFVFFDFIQEGI
jgi:hypothetical protein